ncbi:MAG: xanthine dehydrogenase family protein molybdopterin-binding subunit, partial [Candidatus Dormibacterales bacterium]
MERTGHSALLGTPQRRIEGRAKVTGGQRFTADLDAGAAPVRLVLSPHPHARITGVERAAAEAVPGVLAVVTGADLPALNVPGPDLPLARETVFYAGQPVAAVVAETEQAAADAAALLEVYYEALPAAVDPFEAMKDGAPLVLDAPESVFEDAGAHGTAGVGGEAEEEKPRNVHGMARFEHGDAHGALKASRVVVNRRYEVPSVHQGFIETHVSAARPEPDGTVTVWTSTQGVFLCRETIAKTLGEPHSRFRIQPMSVGGGFGGKICLLEPLAVLLCRRVKRAVQIALTRAEEFLVGRPGPGAVVDLRLGADAGGRLTAMWARLTLDHGATAMPLAGFACAMLGGAYRVPNWDLVGYDVATHKTPRGAYRAPGTPQLFFALESALDEISAELGLDPLELRLANASREGDARPDGTLWPRIGFVECLQAAARHPVYTDPLGPGEGVGVAAGGWGGGREPAVATCKVEPDGTLTLQIGSQDISGTDTTLAMIAAEAFGTRLEQVHVERGDSASSPYAGMAGGSKIVYTVGPAVEQAAREARRQVLEIAAEELEADVADLVVQDGAVGVRGVVGRSLEVGHLAGLAAQFGSRYLPVQGQGRAAVTAQSPMFTVHLARVQVDAETGAYRLTRYAAVQDVGRALNPPEVEAQVHGGVVQGLGRALGEEILHDDAGTLLTGSFLAYALPSIDQVPEIEVGLVEVPSPHGPQGAKGVGEPPAVPPPAAVANAIARATGHRLTRLPV